MDELKDIIQGDIESNKAILEEYSHDTSLFEVKPSAVIFPKNSDDVKKIVDFVSKNKAQHPELSITARSGGSDMSGGAINDSFILSFERYMNRIGDVRGNRISVEPGAWYRDFEKVTLASKKLFPSYPASRELCALGGIVANNAGGEKSLTYGKTEEFVRSLDVVLSDGNEYHIKPLGIDELKAKIAQKDFEGKIYKSIFDLIENNYETIMSAKPNVTKNSTGYKLWDVWDRDRKIFDLTQLFIGSQGTLGLITDIEMALVDVKPHSGLLVGYLKSTENLGEIINEVLKHKPTAFETFDDHTFKFAIRFFFQFRKTLGWWGLAKLGISFLPDLLILLRTGIPKLLILVEYEGFEYDNIENKLELLEKDLKRFDVATEITPTERKSERFWLMRRESFNLLRKNVHGKHTAPFIDDLVVPPTELPAFLPKLNAIIEKYELLSTVAGHMGDGNFHIIPLMDLTDEKEREKIEPCLLEVLKLVKEHGGSLSGEHNDGLIRSPFLENMYGKEITGMFKEVKMIFDPNNIFNPHKKTDASWKYSKKHMRDHF
jgi:FAD/FMN-containing dehydrogenase